ncbi:MULTISPECIES: sensor histidine kinase [unclassified Paenibacillus]|uniref:sensor histidine kinase n=1 Tax=unclassified Paenibacillus TaxID=185978 RepID=UPI0010493131|nr:MULTISPECIES: sensor histidine kinase [unclassified Paenibacillus]NIK70745.1 two-component system sensor histidine kinase YesM [Paenibacillus sp. BK720]TCM93283.1 two-component system sensor histidine kinase YesM [Paenibacillus sp. BK033]
MELFKFKSIQTNIAAASACLILLTAILLGVISYQLSASSVRETAQDYTAELIRQVNANIQTYITSMENISMLALSNEDVRELVGEAGSDGQSSEGLAREQRISAYFHSIMASRKDIASINVIGYNGRFVSDREHVELNPSVRLAEQPWYTSAQEASGRIVVSSSHVQHMFKDEYGWVVSLSRELWSKDQTEPRGVLLVDLNFSVINDTLNNIDLSKRGYIFIVDEAGNIVYHPQQQLIYSNLKSEKIDEVLAKGSGSFMTDEGKTSRIYTIQDTGFGWKIVGVSYVNELIGNKREMQLSMAAAGIFCLIVGLLLAVFVSRNLSRPIKQLQEHMKKVEKGIFNIRVPIGNPREIASLARTFNLMVVKIEELMSQVVREQEIKRKSELTALQAQINPHFLYNTLDSIIWMAEGKKTDEVVLMTSALARLFRSSISRGQELVSIRTEIEHVANYLTIQKIRYKDKLDFQIDIDPDIYAYRTLKVLLQPLLENAIYHGIKNRIGTGTIQVTGGKRDGYIWLEVSDNGVGMEAEALRTILEPRRSDRESKGVGVVNVHERIQLYFGKDYGLTYRSVPDEGTTVTVRIAAIEGDEWAGGAGA